MRKRTSFIDSRKGTYIPTLDGWRALAISLVIGSHAIEALRSTGTSIGRRIASVLMHGNFGVDIFFALSGYLICTLLLQERQINGAINLPHFYIRRAFRILPPILVYLFALAILSVTGTLPQVTWMEILGVLAFVRNYVPGSIYTAHFWSLAVEEHFYLVVPLLLSRLRWASAITVVLLVAVISASIRAWEYGLINFGVVDFHTESRLDALMYGAALAILFQHEPIRNWFTRNLSGWAALLLVSALTIAYCFTDPQAQGFRRTVVALVLPLLVLYTVLHPRSASGRFLELNVIRWVGRLSFSLYIWQELFIFPGNRLLGVLQQLPWCLAAALACAVVSYYLVEKRFIRIGHRLASVGRNAPVLVSSGK